MKARTSRDTNCSYFRLWTRTRTGCDAATMGRYGKTPFSSPHKMPIGKLRIIDGMHETADCKTADGQEFRRVKTPDESNGTFPLQ